MEARWRKEKRVIGSTVHPGEWLVLGLAHIMQRRGFCWVKLEIEGGAARMEGLDPGGVARLTVEGSGEGDWGCVGGLKITEDKSSKSRIQTSDARLIIATSATPRREG